MDVAYDGENGLDLGLSEEYDVIVLDRLLPKLEGVQMVKEIRKNNIHTPILILVAKGQQNFLLESEH